MDTVLAFLLLPDNRVFLGSSVVLSVLFLLEVVGLAFGASLSHIINANVDTDHNGIPDVLEGSSMLGVVSWIGFGKVPATIVFALFLAYFSIFGLVINWVSLKQLAVTWPWMITVPFAVGLSMVPLRIATRVIARVLPKDFSTAVSVDELVGTQARIITGTATASMSAEAQARDRFGETHFVRVKPIDPAESIPKNTIVYLDKREGGHFLVSKANQE